MRHYFQPLILALLLAVTPTHPVTPSPPPPRLPKIRWSHPPRPPNLGEPGGRGQGGGSRGDCTAYKDTTVLHPNLQSLPEGTSSWGLTTLSHPTLCLHAPKGLAAKVPLELTLQDNQNKPLFKKLLTPPATPAGIIPIAFPPEAPALQPNQTYHWAISIYCDAEVPDQPITLRGTLTRTTLSPELTQRLEQSTTIEKAELYAQNGIWYDTLTTLGIAKLTTPSYPLTIAWKDLLRQANLNTLITAPLQTIDHPQ